MRPHAGGFQGILRGNRRAGSRQQRPAATAGHPASDGDCEKVRAGIPAAARRVSAILALLNRRLNEMSGFNFFLTEVRDEVAASVEVNPVFPLG